MALDYTEHTWGYGEEFTPDKLNNMEHGIKAASDAVNEVNNNLIKMVRGTFYITLEHTGMTQITNDMVSNQLPDDIANSVFRVTSCSADNNAIVTLHTDGNNLYIKSDIVQSYMISWFTLF